jgi:UDP-3-O-[3-hydroxymyristoyl] glucosamine N-acyltransferase
MYLKSFPLSAIKMAEICDGNLVGTVQDELTGVASLKNAASGQTAIYVSSAFKDELGATKASVVIMSADLHLSSKYKGPVILVDNPRLALKECLSLLATDESTVPFVHNTAIIHPSVKIPASVSIGPRAVIAEGVSIADEVVIAAGTIIEKNCHIDRGTVIDANVILRSAVVLGKYCQISPGVVIGSEGFSFVKDQNKCWQELKHCASVVLEDKVCIGANSTIDRGLFDPTVIEEGVKIDNLVHIGHNCRIGAHTIIAGHSGIAGSVEIGRYCLIGGGVGIADHVKIADHTILNAGTGVTTSIAVPGQYGSVAPCMPVNLWRLNMASLKKLRSLFARMAIMEKKIG